MWKLNGRWSCSSSSSSGGEHAIKRRDLLDSVGSAATGTSGRGLVARRHDDCELVGSASWIYERKPRSTKLESEFDSSVKFALVVLLAKAPKCGRRLVCSLPVKNATSYDFSDSYRYFKH
jgi:hypothetical protein